MLIVTKAIYLKLNYKEVYLNTVSWEKEKNLKIFCMVGRILLCENLFLWSFLMDTLLIYACY
jgi:hypothetical protein